MFLLFRDYLSSSLYYHFIFSLLQSHEIHDLDTYTQYLISIQVFNPEGIGPATNVVVMTDEGSKYMIFITLISSYGTICDILSTLFTNICWMDLCLKREIALCFRASLFATSARICWHAFKYLKADCVSGVMVCRHLSLLMHTKLELINGRNCHCCEFHRSIVERQWQVLKIASRLKGENEIWILSILETCRGIFN